MKKKAPKKVLTVRLDPKFVAEMQKCAKLSKQKLSVWMREWLESAVKAFY